MSFDQPFMTGERIVNVAAPTDSETLDNFADAVEHALTVLTGRTDPLAALSVIASRMANPRPPTGKVTTQRRSKPLKQAATSRQLAARKAAKTRRDNARKKLGTKDGPLLVRQVVSAGLPGLGGRA